MIKIENVDVWGFEHAVRAMRNPLNSWDKSDSRLIRKTNVSRGYGSCGNFQQVDVVEEMFVKEGGNYKEHIEFSESFVIGKKDLDLMRRLYKSGTEHRTYARMIQVSMDIVAPLYWWKDMDRYTVGKSQVGCSTMHKIHDKEFELDDFSWDQLLNDDCPLFIHEWDFGKFHNRVQPQQFLIDFIIPSLNVCRKYYLETKDKKYWWQLIQLLPSSYNQRRTVCMSYETVFKIIRERTGHKLDEFNEFVDELKNLPYVKEIIGEKDGE